MDQSTAVNYAVSELLVQFVAVPGLGHQQAQQGILLEDSSHPLLKS